MADLINPLMNTPTTTATIKSILQSARKTALNSSPIRVPFALSPMAHKHHPQHSFSTADTIDDIRRCPLIVAKDPSLHIKEAFLSNSSNNSNSSSATELDQFLSPLPTNKRFLENEDEEEHDEEITIKDQQQQEEEALPHHKREKLEETADEMYTSVTDVNNAVDEDFNATSNTVDFIMNINDTHDHSYNNSTENDNNINTHETINNESFASTDGESKNSLTSPSSLFTLNYSELLANPKDPELKSPELLSNIDRSISRSENQDRSTPLHNNSLLPSGIIKLLERKRQERRAEQNQLQQLHQHSQPHDIKSNSIPNRKKFDLQESLKKPLPYKPHLGSLKPKSDSRPQL